MDHEERLKAALADRYLIEREIGSGGMATVYLAQDLKHGRKVAVKVLKPELAAVMGTKRFLAEIRTTANLTHPHILPLHDSGEADGFLFYVMPYVHGESLRTKLDRDGQLSVEEAVRVSGHVADALDHAHRQGVIHRDVKPSNILFEDDQPVVTDFGIALAVSAAGEGRLTETGLSLGTPYYMSPEQAAGDQTPTAASDVYSLGCVLYEMLTGEPPHTGASAQAILGKILLAEVTRPTKLRRTVPANVEGAVLKALERLPADRFDTAAELTAALKDKTYRHGAQPGAAVEAVGARWRRVALGLAATTVTTAAVALWLFLRSQPPQDPVRVKILLEPEMLAEVGMAGIALPPDGSFLVYTASHPEAGTQLFLRRFRNLDPVPVRGSAGGSFPSVSPDGREVAFLVGPQALSLLHAVELDGGNERTLADSVFCCIHWGTDGFIYFTDAALRVRRVPAAGGPVQPVTPVIEGRYSVFPYLAPGGEVLFYLSATSDLDAELRALRLDTGKEAAVVSPAVGGQVQHLPSGHFLFADEQGRLLVAPFDTDKLELTGVPVHVAQGLQTDPFRGGPKFSVSTSGMLVYESVEKVTGKVLPVWVDRSGNVEPVDPEWLLDPGTGARGFALSPDGTKVAVAVSPEGTNDRDIYVKQLPRGPFSRLTNDPGVETRPRWTPDGRSVTYLSDQSSSSWNVLVKRADGTVSEAELLADEEQPILEAILSPPNGEWLVMRVGTDLGERDIAVKRLADDSVVRTISEPGSWQTAPALSPDGRWLAYVSDETGRREVYVRSFPDMAARKVQISTSGGRMPVWGRSGPELFFVNSERELVAVEVTLGADLEVGDQEALFTLGPEILIPELENGVLLDVDVDDQRFLMLQSMAAEANPELVVVFNWLEELEERLREGG